MGPLDSGPLLAAGLDSSAGFGANFGSASEIFDLPPSVLGCSTELDVGSTLGPLIGFAWVVSSCGRLDSGGADLEVLASGSSLGRSTEENCWTWVTGVLGAGVSGLPPVLALGAVFSVSLGRRGIIG